MQMEEESAEKGGYGPNRRKPRIYALDRRKTARISTLRKTDSRRRIRFRGIKKSKIRKCSESNSGRPILTSKSGQNDPGTLIIEFALKNYAQKWSQIFKVLDGFPQNDDFGIFVRSLRTLL